jgi:ABC-type multidrug transport system fused ATPase/permease subunit
LHITPIVDSKKDSAKPKNTNDEMKSGELMSKERTLDGPVPLGVYFTFFLRSGWFTPTFFLALFIACEALTLGGSYWLALWTSQAYKDLSKIIVISTFDHPIFTAMSDYTWIYVGITMTGTIVTVLRGATLSKLISESSYGLYKRMIHSLLRAPLSWFDTTPIGRILNRATKDQENVDNQLPVRITFCALIYCSYLTTTIMVNKNKDKIMVLS